MELILLDTIKVKVGDLFKSCHNVKFDPPPPTRHPSNVKKKHLPPSSNHNLHLNSEECLYFHLSAPQTKHL